MKQQRKTYTKEFKLETIRLYESSDKSAAQIEHDLELPVGIIHKWRYRLKGQGRQAFVVGLADHRVGTDSEPDGALRWSAGTRARVERGEAADGIDGGARHERQRTERKSLGRLPTRSDALHGCLDEVEVHLHGDEPGRLRV